MELAKETQRNPRNPPPRVRLRHPPTTPQPPPINLNLLSSSSSSSLSYTSLKDLIPSTTASINSPTTASSASSEVSLRHRLLKHAALDYLHPTSGSSESTGSTLRRFWLWVSSSIAAFLRLLSAITGALDRILRSIRLRMHGCYP